MKDENVFKESSVYKCVEDTILAVPRLLEATSRLIATNAMDKDLSFVASYIKGCIKGNPEITQSDALEVLKLLQNSIENNERLEVSFKYVSNALSGGATTLSQAHLFTTALGFIEGVEQSLLSNARDDINFVREAWLKVNSECAKHITDKTHENDLLKARELIYKEIGISDIADQAKKMHCELGLIESAEDTANTSGAEQPQPIDRVMYLDNVNRHNDTDSAGFLA